MSAGGVSPFQTSISARRTRMFGCRYTYHLKLLCRTNQFSNTFGARPTGPPLSSAVSVICTPAVDRSEIEGEGVLGGTAKPWQQCPDAGVEPTQKSSASQTPTQTSRPCSATASVGSPHRKPPVRNSAVTSILVGNCTTAFSTDTTLPAPRCRDGSPASNRGGMTSGTFSDPT